jgi:hypothetical protein
MALRGIGRGGIRQGRISHSKTRTHVLLVKGSNGFVQGTEGHGPLRPGQEMLEEEIAALHNVSP